MDLHELRVAARLIDGLAKRALFAEKQMVALEGQCAEWQRIADELKAERDAAKQEAASARQDAVTRAEADRKRIDGLMIQVQDMRAEIERLKKPARKHPVAVGEWVERTGGGGAYPIGTVAQVNQYSPSGDYLVRLAGQTRIVTWFKENCTPCDPPEATHDTPEGKQAAESVIRNDRKTEPDEIKVGDVAKVRSASGNLTAKCNVGQIGEVLKIDSRDGTVLLSGEAGWVDIQDVRKVTT